MLAQPVPPKKSTFKNRFLYSWAALGIAALVVGWILFSRWYENRGIEKHANEERTQKQQEQDRLALEQLRRKGARHPRLLRLSGRDSPRRNRPVVLRRGQRQNRQARTSAQSRLALVLPLR